MLKNDEESFIPLNPKKVQENLRERSLLREFKTWFIAMNMMHKKLTINKYNDNGKCDNNNVVNRRSSKNNNNNFINSLNHNNQNHNHNNNAYNKIVTSDRIKQVIHDHEDGLMQFVAGGHPWVVGGSARRSFDMESINKAKKFLTFLDLAPSVKNAKKVMDVIKKILA